MPAKKINRLEFESLDPVQEPEESQPQQEQEAAMKFSVNAVRALGDKRKEHNLKNPVNKVTLNQLKDVFCRGAGNCSDAEGSLETCSEWALARVNMFLRQKSGEKIESSLSVIEMEGSIVDISDSWAPSDEDFKQAKADVLKYDLNYDFKDVNDLYLDEYKKIHIEW